MGHSIVRLVFLCLSVVCLFCDVRHIPQSHHLFYPQKRLSAREDPA